MLSRYCKQAPKLVVNDFYRFLTRKRKGKGVDFLNVFVINFDYSMPMTRPPSHATSHEFLIRFLKLEARKKYALIMAVMVGVLVY